jgi:hypothetical protein
MRRLQIGYVVIDRRRTAPELRQFVGAAFPLTLVWSDDALELYRTSLVPPLVR